MLTFPAPAFQTCFSSFQVPPETIKCVILQFFFLLQSSTFDIEINCTTILGLLNLKSVIRHKPFFFAQIIQRGVYFQIFNINMTVINVQGTC